MPQVKVKEKPIKISQTPRAKVVLAVPVHVDRGPNMTAILPRGAEGQIVNDDVVLYHEPFERYSQMSSFCPGALVRITDRSGLLGEFIIPLAALRGEPWRGQPL